MRSILHVRMRLVWLASSHKHVAFNEGSKKFWILIERFQMYGFQAPRTARAHRHSAENKGAKCARCKEDATIAIVLHGGIRHTLFTTGMVRRGECTGGIAAPNELDREERSQNPTCTIYDWEGAPRRTYRGHRCTE
jgi:hypothetical protein